MPPPSAELAGIGGRDARVVLKCMMGISELSVSGRFDTSELPGLYGPYRFGIRHISSPSTSVPFPQSSVFLLPLPRFVFLSASLVLLSLKRDFF